MNNYSKQNRTQGENVAFILLLLSGMFMFVYIPSVISMMSMNVIFIFADVKFNLDGQIIDLSGSMISYFINMILLIVYNIVLTLILRKCDKNCYSRFVVAKVIFRVVTIAFNIIYTFLSGISAIILLESEMTAYIVVFAIFAFAGLVITVISFLSIPGMMRYRKNKFSENVTYTKHYMSSEKQLCPDCGMTVEKESSYCPLCGKKL